jgi:hypothetical protein
VCDPDRLALLVYDMQVGVVRVKLDGTDVLDAVTFLVEGDEVTIGGGADPSGPARFSGTIRELPVRTPLCDSVRSRYRAGSSS